MRAARNPQGPLFVLAVLAIGFIDLVAYCAFGWAGVFTVGAFMSLFALAARSSQTRKPQPWYWDRSDDAPRSSYTHHHYNHRAPAPRRPRRNTRGGAR